MWQNKSHLGSNMVPSSTDGIGSSAVKTHGKVPKILNSRHKQSYDQQITKLSFSVSGYASYKPEAMWASTSLEPSVVSQSDVPHSAPGLPHPFSVLATEQDESIENIFQPTFVKDTSKNKDDTCKRIIEEYVDEELNSFYSVQKKEPQTKVEYAACTNLLIPLDLPSSKRKSSEMIQQSEQKIEQSVRASEFQEHKRNEFPAQQLAVAEGTTLQSVQRRNRSLQQTEVPLPRNSRIRKTEAQQKETRVLNSRRLEAYDPEGSSDDDSSGSSQTRQHLSQNVSVVSTDSNFKKQLCATPISAHQILHIAKLPREKSCSSHFYYSEELDLRESDPFQLRNKVNQSENSEYQSNSRQGKKRHLAVGVPSKRRQTSKRQREGSPELDMPLELPQQRKQGVQNEVNSQGKTRSFDGICLDPRSVELTSESNKTEDVLENCGNHVKKIVGMNSSTSETVESRSGAVDLQRLGVSATRAHENDSHTVEEMRNENNSSSSLRSDPTRNNPCKFGPLGSEVNTVFNSSKRHRSDLMEHRLDYAVQKMEAFSGSSESSKSGSGRRKLEKFAPSVVEGQSLSPESVLQIPTDGRIFDKARDWKKCFRERSPSPRVTRKEGFFLNQDQETFYRTGDQTKPPTESKAPRNIADSQQSWDDKVFDFLKQTGSRVPSSSCVPSCSKDFLGTKQNSLDSTSDWLAEKEKEFLRFCARKTSGEGSRERPLGYPPVEKPFSDSSDSWNAKVLSFLKQTALPNTRGSCSRDRSRSRSNERVSRRSLRSHGRSDSSDSLKEFGRCHEKSLPYSMQTVALMKDERAFTENNLMNRRTTPISRISSERRRLDTDKNSVGSTNLRETVFVRGEASGARAAWSRLRFSVDRDRTAHHGDQFAPSHLEKQTHVKGNRTNSDSAEEKVVKQRGEEPVRRKTSDASRKNWKDVGLVENHTDGKVEQNQEGGRPFICQKSDRAVKTERGRSIEGSVSDESNVPYAGRSYTKKTPGPVQLLMKFSEKGNLHQIQYLLRNHKEIGSGDILDEFGWSAVMYAAKGGHLNVFEYLKTLGADVNAQEPHGNHLTLFEIALAFGQEKFARNMTPKYLKSKKFQQLFEEPRAEALRCYRYQFKVHAELPPWSRAARDILRGLIESSGKVRHQEKTVSKVSTRMRSEEANSPDSASYGPGSRERKFHNKTPRVLPKKLREQTCK